MAPRKPQNTKGSKEDKSDKSKKKRTTANSTSSALDASERRGRDKGESSLAGLLKEVGVDVNMEELDDSEEETEEEETVMEVEEAAGPTETTERGNIRGVDPTNPNIITHDDVFRVPKEKFASYEPPADIVHAPDQPLLLCKFKLQGRIHQLALLSSERMSINFFFNDYLSTKVPDMEGYYWEINMEADKIKFIPNSTCTKWFGVAECLRDKTMLSMSRTGAINLTPQQIDLFDKPEHCLAFRFVLVFPPGENCHPRLAVRVIRRTQTEAQSLINKLDVASMNVGSFSLNTIRANGIDQADGVPFSLYYTLFNKACTMNTYRGLLQGTLRIFLLMVYTHMNHSIASYEEAVRKKETGNIQRFKDLVRPNHREPLESRINDQGTSGQDQADLRQQAAKEMRLQNAYSAGRPDGSGFPPLSLLNPMLNQSKRSAVVDPLPSPALTRDKGTPHEDTDQDDSEEDQSEEETHSSPAKKKSPIKKKSKDKTQDSSTAKKLKTKHPSDRTPLTDITNLKGLDLYTELLSQGKIGSRSTIQACKLLGLTPQDLATVFPNVDLQTLSQPSGLFLSLKELGVMNRTEQAKPPSSSKITMDVLHHNLALVTQPREFPACFDDLSGPGTSLRMFHRLPLTTMQESFLLDAKNHQDLRPIAAYNLADINGAACVTEKGWADAHNPGNPRVSIKEYMTKNINPSQSKRMVFDDSLMLVDTSSAREADTIKELRRAWSLLLRIMHMTHPALLNYHTMDSFLVDKEFFYHEEKKGLTQANFATHFIDFYLGIISECYRNINPPPTKHDLDGHLRAFKDSIAGTSRPSNNSSGNSRTGRGSNTTPGDKKGKGGKNNKKEADKDTKLCKYFNLKSGCGFTEEAGDHCKYKGDRQEHLCNFTFKFGKQCLKKHCAATSHETT